MLMRTRQLSGSATFYPFHHQLEGPFGFVGQVDESGVIPNVAPEFSHRQLTVSTHHKGVDVLEP